jgi:hypothetical protein
MELIKLNIPAQFVSERARLTWREVLYGIDNELLAPGAAVEFAAGCAATGSSSPALVELAELERGEVTRTHVERLAEPEEYQPTEQIKEKWLYIVLAWIFEHRGAYPDALEVVEEVYADFGYPPIIADFVRYMPTDEPDLGSRELNEKRLYEKWKRYLDTASAGYASAPGMI